MRFILLFVLISGFFSLLCSCESSSENNELTPPATLVKVPGSEFNQVVLSQDAVNRIGLELTPLTETTLPAITGTEANMPKVQTVPQANVQPLSITNTPSSQVISTKQIPYSAIIYGLHGESWVYVLVKPLTFMRMKVTIDHIIGDTAILSEGPPPNTQIVSVGASELYGAEYIGNIEP